MPVDLCSADIWRTCTNSWSTNVCAGDLIIPHLLWADDLVLFFESENGLQRQLYGLQRFCENNLMIVNNLKTKEILGKHTRLH